jgi:protocatechuate 3,4-dioxygenase beta subunit
VLASSGVLPSCVVRPELTVGPYFVDRQLDRSDIRIEPSTGKAVEGVPLALTFNVSSVGGGRCTPLANAMVDVWHCDAHGVYSAVDDRMSGTDSSSQKFCRGYQVTDPNGVARFTTIYPGWYRTVHIHFKIRTPADAALADRRDQLYEFTSQLFFDEALNDRVYGQAPYSGKGRRDTTNERDGIEVQIPRLRAARSARDDSRWGALRAPLGMTSGASPSERTSLPVIPSERSESRDLHPAGS